MQVEILKKNDIESKLKTRYLYENCFDIGKDDFVNYYYDEIIKRNEIVVVKDGDDIVSMVHLNPYTYDICGSIKLVHYLVGIATDENYRGKGLMRLCITKALEYLNSLNEPFCYLVPDNNELEKAYQKFGFVTVSKFVLDKFSNDKYDIFPFKSDEYLKLMKNEDYFLRFETKEYIEELSNKLVMINVLDKINYDIDFFKNKKIYVCQEV